MAIGVVTSGSQTAVITTEHTLATVASGGTYSAVIDLNAMAAGDITEIRVYGKARSADTERVILVYTFANVQGSPLAITVPLLSPHHFKITLKQTAGTGRAYPWAVYSA